MFEQDVYNLPEVQLGLEAMTRPGVMFADYQETKPRHFHAILDEWIESTGDQGQFPDSAEELRLVFEGAKGKVAAPEFDFLKREAKR